MGGRPSLNPRLNDSVGQACKMNLRSVILNDATCNADEVIATQRRCYEIQKAGPKGMPLAYHKNHLNYSSSLVGMMPCLKYSFGEK